MSVPAPADRLLCLPLPLDGEVRAGDDLAALLSSGEPLRDGDVLVVTSKVVSKAEGSVARARTAEERDAVVAAQTDRELARRGGTRIVRTRHGFVLAAAGVDASNTAPGTLVLLPRDADASARALRARLAEQGSNVAVVVTDTFGRAWRHGQTDVALGVAGLVPLQPYAGREDEHGNALHVTAPAVADEVAAAADLVKGKLAGVPAALVRGLDRLVLPVGDDGPGASPLLRAEAEDMFGVGAREAVECAAARTDARGFGAPSSPGQLARVLSATQPSAEIDVLQDRVRLQLPHADGPAGWAGRGADRERLAAIAFGHGWVADDAEATDPADPVLLVRPRPVGP